MNDIDTAFGEFEEIINELTDLQAIAGDLTQQLDNYAYGIKQLAPLKDGRLRNSIQLLATVLGDEMFIEYTMVDYGYYQAFGVKPDAQTPFRQLEHINTERTQPFAEPPFAAFQYSNRRFGLPATRFVDFQQMRDDVATMVQNRINQIVN